MTDNVIGTIKTGDTAIKIVDSSSGETKVLFTIPSNTTIKVINSSTPYVPPLITKYTPPKFVPKTADEVAAEFAKDPEFQEASKTLAKSFVRFCQALRPASIYKVMFDLDEPNS
jgi:hypothetical protein